MRHRPVLRARDLGHPPPTFIRTTHSVVEMNLGVGFAPRRALDVAERA